MIAFVSLYTCMSVWNVKQMLLIVFVTLSFSRNGVCLLLALLFFLSFWLKWPWLAHKLMSSLHRTVWNSICRWWSILSALFQTAECTVHEDSWCFLKHFSNGTGFLKLILMFVLMVFYTRHNLLPSRRVISIFMASCVTVDDRVQEVLQNRWLVVFLTWSLNISHMLYIPSEFL